MMKQYEEYKNSGVNWIADIPSHWELVKLKFNASLNISTVDRHELEDEIPVSVCHYPQAYNNEKINKNTVFSSGTCSLKEFENFNLKKDQIIITKDSETSDDIGVPTLVEEDIPNTVCGYHLAMIDVDKNSIHASFLFRYLQSKNVNYYFDTKSNGVTRFGLGKPAMENLPIPIPSLGEQKKIARYLDHQIAIIDDLIKQKEKLIELLKEKWQAVINEAVTKGLNPEAKMKDSGDFWIGRIPRDWNLSKIKFVANIQGRVGYKGYTKEDIVAEGKGAFTLGAKHIDKENNLNLSNPEFISWEKYYESPEIMVKNNDVIFTQRGSLGKVCHINSDIGQATINPSMVILSPIKVFPRYLYYWLTSDRIQNEVEVLQSNTAVPMISQFQLSNFPITLPPEEIQKELVKSMDYSLEALKNISEISISQIEKLKEYRQSLISEAVTGKIDVREWQPTTQQLA